MTIRGMIFLRCGLFLLIAQIYRGIYRAAASVTPPSLNHVSGSPSFPGPSSELPREVIRDWAEDEEEISVQMS